jgi:type IV secretion system protein VirB8
MKTDPSVEAYLEEARTWDVDRRDQAAKSVRRAWTVAAVSVAVTVLAVGALLGLTPLKRVDPFVVRVDNTTGVVDVVPVYRGDGAISELVTRHLLTTYVTARERYALAVAEVDYDTVGSFQSAPLNSAWVALWDRSNPDSPLNIFRDGTTARVQVQAITFLKRASGADDLAQVRFIRAVRPGGTGQEQPTHYIATIQYGYGAPSRDDHTRALNPLGFRVLEYKREPEVAADVAVAGTTP